MARIAKNLSLDPEVVARAERYARRHRTSLSALVGDFLERLGREDPEERPRHRSPKVERLIGIGLGEDPAADPEEVYRRHLEQKYLG